MQSGAYRESPTGFKRDVPELASTGGISAGAEKETRNQADSCATSEATIERMWRIFPRS
jgi:hypothetical protein